MSKSLLCKNKKIKCNNIIKQYKNDYFDDITQENIEERNHKY